MFRLAMHSLGVLGIWVVGTETTHVVRYRSDIYTTGEPANAC
jgi:hypothetical protein